MPNIKARITNKHDTEANWASAVNFTPLDGEVIVYDVDTNHAYPRFKVGDGETLVSALPFSTDILTSYVTETELASALNETTSAINKNIATIDDEVATHVAATNNPHQVTKAQVGLSNVADVLQYSASNPPPYPVTSVAGKTGAVQLNTLNFVGAVTGSYNGSANTTITIPTISGPPGTDGQDGAAAGFGTPTYSTTTGAAGTNASVTVTASGPNTAKIFDFDFTIPRGDTGSVANIISENSLTSQPLVAGVSLNTSSKELTVTDFTGSVGDSNTPVYFASGIPTAMTATYGSENRLWYMSGGSFANSSLTVGSSSKPVYLNDGVITVCTSITIDDGVL